MTSAMDSLTSSFSSAASPQYGVYTGVWTNWSRGRILGATLTTTTSRGDLLIAFTAFFISLIASRVWRIACLIFHRCYSTESPQDTLYHQRQVFLRNSASADGALWKVSQLYWAWRGLASRKSGLVRLVPITVFAVACISGFIVASGFSSQISTAIGSQVLIDGSNCGFVQAGGVTSKGMYDTDKLANAANYAQQCYPSSNGSMSSVLDCTIFPIKNLNFTIDTSAPCPFGKGLCRSETANLHLDTGYIHSNDHLGMNARPEDAVRMRTSLQCAPLATVGYTSSRTTSTLNYTRYHYGNRAPTAVYTDEVDYTLETLDLASQYIAGYRPSSSQYRLDSLISATYRGANDVGNSNWNASTDLSRADGDTMITFLSGNGILALNPINDPWYQMNKSGAEIGMLDLDSSFQAYMPQEPASPLGCVEQFQFCNYMECGPLAGLNDAAEYAAPLFGITESLVELDSFEPLWEKYAGNLSTIQFLWLANTYNTYPNTPYEAVSMLGPQALESRRRLLGSFQGSFQGLLPDNQWQLDVILWFELTLAAIQASVVDVAYGTTDPDFARFLTGASTSTQKDICNNQIINSTHYKSFSLFGLYFTYFVGMLIVITSLALESLLSCYSQRRKKHRDYALIEWNANENLQLQRLAQESAAWGTWDNCAGVVPTTTNLGQVLGSLDLSDRSHPRIQKPHVIEGSRKWQQQSNADEKLAREETINSCDTESTQAHRLSTGQSLPGGRKEIVRE